MGYEKVITKTFSGKINFYNHITPQHIPLFHKKHSLFDATFEKVAAVPKMFVLFSLCKIRKKEGKKAPVYVNFLDLHFFNFLDLHFFNFLDLHFFNCLDLHFLPDTCR